VPDDGAGLGPEYKRDFEDVLNGLRLRYCGTSQPVLRVAFKKASVRGSAGSDAPGCEDVATTGVATMTPPWLRHATTVDLAECDLRGVPFGRELSQFVRLCAWRVSR
jgi:hypothetical protein